jgi:hypothetical protein
MGSPGDGHRDESDALKIGGTRQHGFVMEISLPRPDDKMKLNLPVGLIAINY